MRSKAGAGTWLDIGSSPRSSLGSPEQLLRGPLGSVSLQVWDEANLRAQELAKRDGWVNVPPFDHPLIW